GSPDYAAYSTSANTQAALQTAYDRGDWQPYTPPEPEPAAPEPDPKGFKIAFMADPAFLEWQEDIPPIRREDLKLAAIADNWPLVQALYDHLKAVILMPEGAAEQWQALADAHAIPLVF
ncbi:hypothetical protein RRF56_02540, partial (plasmid) [Nodosilinea sp. E11]